MATVTLTYDELVAQLAAANTTILQQQRELTQKDDELATCKAAGARMNKKLQWIAGVLANEELSAGDKVTAITAYEEHRTAVLREGKEAPSPEETEAEQERVTLARIAKRAGMSAQSVGDSLKRLEQAGAYTKTKHWDNTTHSNYLTIAPTPALINTPRLLKFPEGEKPNHGGKRIKCSGCGSDAILEYRKWICSDCGQVVKEHDPKPVNAAPEPETPETQENSVKVKLTSTEKIKVSTSPARYHETRPTPEKCSHPKNLVRKLGEDWYCSECGGRNEELLKWGGAS